MGVAQLHSKAVVLGSSLAQLANVSNGLRSFYSSGMAVSQPHDVLMVFFLFACHSVQKPFYQVGW